MHTTLTATHAHRNHLLMALFVLLFSSGVLPRPVQAASLSRTAGSQAALVPFTPQPGGFGRYASLQMRWAMVFANQLPTAAADLPVGLYVAPEAAFPVVQQPAHNPAYVSPADGELTHFGLAAGHGSTGLLAHNTAAGAYFDELTLDQTLYLVHGNHTIQAYRITEIRRLRAVQPSSPYSDFLDLDQPGVRLTATDLFYQIYAVDNRLVLQTCLEADGNPNWGRLFLIAEPVEPGFFTASLNTVQNEMNN
jgi:hypothetical protein